MMNERIRELAEQAGINKDAFQFSGTPIKHIVDGPSLEKFAESLIRECVGVADDYVKDCTCDEHINCKHPQSAIGRKIKQHFGVEE
jgi:hypothetical protein